VALDAAEEGEVLYRYKYLPFNEGSLRVITDGTLKFTCPLEFNDPFDCAPAYNPASITNFAKARPDLIKQVGDNQGLSPAKRLQRKGVYIQNLRKAIESEDWIRTLIAPLGVLSLSRTAINILMWSHYAKDHTGFVVGLRIASAPDALLSRVVPHPVSYVTERPMFNLGEGCDIDGYFLTKSLDWEYEQEERVLSIEDGPGIHPYSREHFLDSVIAGSRMRETEYKQLKSAVQQASRDIGKIIPLYRAQLARNKYAVYIPDHPNIVIREP